MSVHAISWVLKHSEAEGTDRLCLLVIANYADDEGLAWPSVARVAKEMRVSERTVQRSIRNLVEGEHLAVDEQGAPDSRIPANRKPNAYRILPRGDNGGVTSDASRGDSSCTAGVTLLSPKPSLEPSKNPPVVPRTHSRSQAPVAPERRDYDLPSLGCENCDSGWADVDVGGMTRCSVCNPDPLETIA